MNKLNPRVTPKIKAFFLATLSGVFLFLAFSPFNWFLFGWVALVPLFWALKDKPLKESFFIGGASFFIFFFLHIFWLNQVTVPGFLILIIILSFYGAVFGVFTNFVLRSSIELFILPFFWVLLEFLRARLFSGFPWGSLALSQWQNLRMIQIADITGMWGVSFLMVMTSCALYALLTRHKKTAYYIGICIVFLGANYTYGHARFDHRHLYFEKGPEVRLLQGNIPQHRKWDSAYAENIIDEYIKLSFTPEGDKPDADLVVWPETSYPYLVQENEKEHLSAIAEMLGTDLFVGASRRDGDKSYNSALYFSGKGEFKGNYDKRHLVPFGEYLPFEGVIGFVRNYIDKPMGHFVPGSEIELFTITTATEIPQHAQEAVIKETSILRFGTLICFEDIFPYISREFREKGADFFVNMNNLAWFGKTSAPWQQVASSVFRAVETRSGIARASNTGITCFIDPAGEVYSVLSENDKAVFVRGAVQDSLKVSRIVSFYVVYGEVFMIFVFVMFVLVLLMEMWRTKSFHKEGERKDR